MKLTLLATSFVVAGVLAMSGCSNIVARSCAAMDVSGEPPTTRKDALACAPKTYDNAVKQGYEGPCIYNGGPGIWGVVVDVTGKRTFREAMRLCGYEPGDHAVVLDREGNVRFAR